MMDGKAAAALQAQERNFEEQIRVYEDWNKKLHDVVRQERERRAAAEADIERLAAALQKAAQEATERNSVPADGVSEVDELEGRCKQLQLELSREQDARRRAETEARRTAEQNQELREKLQVLDETVASLEADAASLKQTAASIARSSTAHS